ncbi:MAG TPA: hypothetical protein VN859_06680 [Steroidobacteraceae bacterium]|nr:hypothetical protein [Steroidobacteraceae bacterium]
MRITNGLVLLLAACGLLCACTSLARAPQPREVLDERSGTTLIIVERPTVLARPRSDVAANARDYLTLVGLQEDRSGRFTTWLIVHRWSTVDPRIAADHGVGSGRLRIIADDREILLSPAAPAPPLLERGDLLFGPHTAREHSAAYPIDVPILHFLATAQSLSANFPDDALPIAYGIWQDGRSALMALVAAAEAPGRPAGQLSGPPPAR